VRARAAAPVIAQYPLLIARVAKPWRCARATRATRSRPSRKHSPPVNPIGDLFKSQVWELARYLGVPQPLIDKAPTADLEADQTDEADLGITYVKADGILSLMLQGFPDRRIVEAGFAPEEVALVRRRVDGTHWKRHLPTTAMVSATAINEFYLRPVDY